MQEGSKDYFTSLLETYEKSSFSKQLPNGQASHKIFTALQYASINFGIDSDHYPYLKSLIPTGTPSTGAVDYTNTFENDVERSLNKITGGHGVREVFLPITKSPVDLLISNYDGHGVDLVVQADGITHFLLNEDGTFSLKSKDQLFDRICNSQKTLLCIRIDKKIWDRLRGEEDRSRYVNKLIADAKVGPTFW